MATRIRLLDELTANQIAAGEVVERPASVLKELVENSLDAGAKRIDIEIEAGGRRLIRVTDDGCGMGRDDALLCLERHATSKIAGPGDLAAIRTFGFRGEALPSIASVSRFALRTAEPGALGGTEILVNGGRMETVREAGLPAGTQIEVRTLFFNTPARRRFLRSEETESGHLEQLFRTFALAHPEVAWSYRAEGREAARLAPAPALRRMEELRGREFARGLAPVEARAGAVRLHGWVGRAGVSRGSRADEFWFVNGRPVDSRALYYGIREGFHNALMRGRHPVAVLFLELPPEDVDVNVHPAKREVRFRNDADIRRFVAAAVAAALQAPQTEPVRAALAGPPPEAPAGPGPAPEEEAAAPISEAAEAAGADREERETGGERVAPAATDWGAGPEPPRPRDLPLEDAAVFVSPAAQPSAERPFGPMRLRVLGIVRDLYVVAESEEGLVLVDQHAAHERVLFERVLKQKLGGGAPSQRLLAPVTLEVSPREAAVLREVLPALEGAGLVLREFGRTTFLIDAVPPFFPQEELKGAVLDIVDELQSSGGDTATRRRFSEELVTRAVCRRAIKAADRIRGGEITRLLEDLLACDLPYTCPHGRPTMVLLTDRELERKFGRVV